MTTLVQYIFYFLFHYPLTLLLNVKICGLENLKLKETGPLIIASNHQSRIDPYLLVLLPFFLIKKIVPVYFMTAEYYFNKKWLRPFIAPFGAYPIQRSVETYGEFFSSTISKLKLGKTIMMFPEGKMTKAGEKEVLYKPGIIYLATKSNAGILPIKIEGIQNFNLVDFLLRKKSFILKIGSIYHIEIKSENKFEFRKKAKELVESIYSL